LIVFGSALILLSALGILTNFGMTTSRRSRLFAFGNVLFFIAPVVFGMRIIARSLHELEYFGFGYAAVGIVVMGLGLALRRRSEKL
jgi:hypothetical protein